MAANSNKVKKAKITRTRVAALKPGETLWDNLVVGFGVRRRKGSEMRSYFVKYRSWGGAGQSLTLGTSGKLAPEAAREAARAVYAELAMGTDPAERKKKARASRVQKPETVADLIDEYVKACEAGLPLVKGKPKSKRTIASDRSAFRKHIRPLLGSTPVAELRRRDVIALRDKVAARPKRDGDGLATSLSTRVVASLSSVLQWAVKSERLELNVARGVELHAIGRRDRRLAVQEYGALGRELRRSREAPLVKAAVLFLAFSGWRRGEALGLRWSDLDMESATAVLPMTKTGKSIRPLGRAALSVLRSLPKIKGNDHVFPGRKGTLGQGTFWRTLARIVEAARLPKEVTAHVLRHSFVSVGDDINETESAIAACVGHKRNTMTSRYSHRSSAANVAAANRISDEISIRMGFAKRADLFNEAKRIPQSHVAKIERTPRLRMLARSSAGPSNRRGMARG